MKIFLRVIAYLGLAMMVGAIYVTSRHYFYELTSARNPYIMYQKLDYSWVPVAWLIGCGSIFALTGSLIGRMRNIRLLMIIIGSVSVLSFLPEYYLWYRPPVSLPPSVPEPQGMAIWRPTILDIIKQMKFTLPGFG